MSWAEEQDWFGFEDQALEAPYDSDYDLDCARSGIEFIAIPAWRMKDGKLIAIRDMETSHIKNCIKMIYRSNGKWRHQYLRYFETELRRRKFLNKPSIVTSINYNNMSEEEYEEYLNSVEDICTSTTLDKVNY